MLSLGFVSVDASLGRIDYSSFSDQTLMELLIDGLSEDSKYLFQDGDGAYKDVCDWIIVECHAEGNVNVVRCGFVQLEGSISTECMPPNITDFDLSSRGLSGSCQVRRLPKSLTSLRIDENKFEGTVDFTGFPEKMHTIVLYSNRFHGSCGFTALPEPLTHLNISHNAFSGAIRLDRLPQGLQCLNLRGNKLSGRIRLLQPPGNLRYVNLSDNAFSGTAVIQRSLPAHHTGLYSSGVRHVVDEHGKAHPRAEDLLEAPCASDWLWSIEE